MYFKLGDIPWLKVNNVLIFFSVYWRHVSRITSQQINRRRNIQHNDRQHNNAQHIWLNCHNEHKQPSGSWHLGLALNVNNLSVTFFCCCVVCCCAECHYDEYCIFLLQCWISLCQLSLSWVSLCWLSVCRVSLCWMSSCLAKTSAYILLQSSKNLSLLVNFVSTCCDFGYNGICPNTNSAKLGQMFGKKSI